MARPIFYHRTIKTIISSFGTIFDNVRYINDHDEEIKVPLHYSPKEKFVSFIIEKPDLDTLTLDNVLPRMGFEMTGMSFASERYVNPLNRMKTFSEEEKKYLYSRVPYDFEFSLYLATRKFEDSLKIVEQIIPFFTPELNITIRDKEDFDLKTDVPVILNSVGYNIDYEGTTEFRRTVTWTLTFTVKAWIYGDVKEQAVIKKTITNLSRDALDTNFARFTSEILPRSATINDDYIIRDAFTNNSDGIING